MMRRRVARWSVLAALALGVLLLSASPSVATAPPGVWTSNGPFGGVVRAVTVDPASTSTLYAATQSGVFKSTDSGLTGRLRAPVLPNSS